MKFKLVFRREVEDDIVLAFHQWLVLEKSVCT